MNSTEQIKALCLKHSLSENVKQEIIKIVNKVSGDAYNKGYKDNSGKHYEGYKND